MLPSLHQLSRFFVNAKTHKFENFNDLLINNLKGKLKVITKYLKPLTKKEFVITNTQQFLRLVKRVRLH